MEPVKAHNFKFDFLRENADVESLWRFALDVVVSVEEATKDLKAIRSNVA